MQTEGQTSTVDTGASGSSDPDALSPAEMAYLNSGGRDSAALEAEWAGNGQGSPQSGNDSPDGSQQGQHQNGASDDEDGDGEEVIVMGKDGKPRSGNSGRFVPHQALHKERERRKATESELQQARDLATRANERIAVFTDLLNRTQQQQQPTGEQDDPQPDPEKDIFAFVKWQGRQIERLSGQLNERASKFDAHTAEQQFRQSYYSDAIAFQQKTPDFRDAYSHLVKGRDAELQALGMTDAQARKQHIAKEEREIAEHAKATNRSPSEVLYELAKVRGYVAKAQNQQQNGKPDGQQQPDHMKKIEQIAKGQRVAGNPLSNAGGSSGEGLTAEAFLNMNEDEYAAAIAKLSPSQRRTLLGG